MKTDDLTPEQLYNLLLELDAHTAARLKRLYSEFSKEIANIPGVKSYLSGKKLKTFSDINGIKGIDGKIDKLIDEIYSIVISAQETAWRIGEKFTETLVLSKISSELSDYLRKSGLFKHRNKAMNAFKLNKDKFDISTRVWKDGIKTQIEESVQLAVSNGESAQKLSKDLREYLQEPKKLFRRVRDKETGELKLSKAAKQYHPGQGVYRSSYMNARRLAATEINNSYRMAEWESYQNNPVIVGFQIRLSNNHTLKNPVTGKPEPFIDICDYAQGKYPKDFVWYGWHPHCRCIMTPIFATQDEQDAMTQAILDGKDPTTVKPKMITDIPKKFIEWSRIHRKQISGWNTLPHYITNNPKYAEKYFIYKSVFKDAQGFYSVKTFENGGNVKIHQNVNKKASDYKDIYNISMEFAKMGKKTAILPNVHFKSKEYKNIFGALEGTPYHQKCPDFKVGNKFYEYESYTTPFKKRKISNMLSHGFKQSPYLVINNNKGASDRYITKVINDRIKDKNFQYDIKEVWLYEKGKIRLLYKRSGR